MLEQCKVIPFPQAMQQAGVAGPVVDVQLCRAGGGYVYRARILKPDGQVQAVNIPAG